MKRVLAIMALLLVVGFLVVLLTYERTGEAEDQESISKTSPSTEKGNQSDARDKRHQYEVKEQKKLLEGFHRAANENDGETFRTALSDLLSKNFTGDPKQILTELEHYLDHENKLIRFELAKTCIWAGLHNDKVVETLCAFINDENSKPVEKELPGHPGEKYIEDFRRDAAKLLTAYRIHEAVNPLWNAYQQTSNHIYLRYLSVFKDNRVGDEAVNLIELEKAKYIDLHEIFGTYRVEKAAEPLEAIFKARRERYPEKNQSELAWSLYQITQKQEYYDYLIQREAYVNNTFLEVPNVLEILRNSLMADDGSDLNAKGGKSFLSLLARKGGREIIENYLVEVFDEKIVSSLDATLRYQVAAHLDNERVNAAAQRYEEKYGNGLWPHYSKRKGWPINNLIIDYRY